MMRRVSVLSAMVLLYCAVSPGHAAANKDAASAAQLIAEGDKLVERKQFEKAMEAYKKADKVSNHTCAECFLRMVRVNKYTGNLSEALDDAKHAVKAAGDDKKEAAKARMVRGTLLAQMAGKPKDKKLKESEDEFREALTLDPAQCQRIADRVALDHVTQHDHVDIAPQQRGAVARCGPLRFRKTALGEVAAQLPVKRRAVRGAEAASTGNTAGGLTTAPGAGARDPSSATARTNAPRKMHANPTTHDRKASPMKRATRANSMVSPRLSFSIMLALLRAAIAERPVTAIS